MIGKNKNNTVYNVVNNSPDDLVEIKIPDYWWQSHNNYFIKKNNSLKIIDIKPRGDLGSVFTPLPGWDIKNGDYFINDFPSKTPLSKELRRKLEFYLFIIILLGSGFFSWLIAYLISKI